MSFNKREFEQLPDWLQECWNLSPAIARKAEKYIDSIKPLSSDAVLCAVPIVAGNSYGIQFLCSACDFPKDETLTMDMKHCWNCGVKLDWSKCEY